MGIEKTELSLNKETLNLERKDVITGEKAGKGLSSITSEIENLVL